MSDLLAKLDDLLKQATTERTHFYVAGCLTEAIVEIRRLREKCHEHRGRADKAEQIVERLRELSWFEMKEGQQDTTTYLNDCHATAVLPDLFKEIMEEE